MVDLITETCHYVPCPWCGEKAAQIDHLLGHGDTAPRYRPWNCAACGQAYHVTITAGIVTTEKVEEPAQYKKLVLLKIPPQTTPIYLVLHTPEYSPENGCGAGDQYFYNEHTCPTNWTRDIVMMIQGDSADPHGVAQWVASIPAGDLMDRADQGDTRLATLGEDPLPGGGTIEHPDTQARRVLALFGVTSKDHHARATLRAEQAERLRHAFAYRKTVGDPVDILTTLLPMCADDLLLLDDDSDA